MIVRLGFSHHLITHGTSVPQTAFHNLTAPLPARVSKTPCGARPPWRWSRRSVRRRPGRRLASWAAKGWRRSRAAGRSSPGRAALRSDSAQHAAGWSQAKQWAEATTPPPSQSGGHATEGPHESAPQAERERGCQEDEMKSIAWPSTGSLALSCFHSSAWTSLQISKQPAEQAPKATSSALLVEIAILLHGRTNLAWQNTRFSRFVGFPRLWGNFHCSWWI